MATSLVLFVSDLVITSRRLHILVSVMEITSLSRSVPLCCIQVSFSFCSSAYSVFQHRPRRVAVYVNLEPNAKPTKSRTLVENMLKYSLYLKSTS